VLIATTLLAGAALALALVYLARRRSPEGELRLYAIGLLVAALIYVGFAVLGGASQRWLALELLGVLGFGAVAWAGLRGRSALLLAAGWAAHTLWDVLLHLDGQAAAYTPDCYPWLCLGFDLVIAGALLGRRRSR